MNELQKINEKTKRIEPSTVFLILAILYLIRGLITQTHISDFPYFGLFVLLWWAFKKIGH